MKVRVLLISLMFIGSLGLQAQSTEELDAYNTYINFLNESVHGLVIAHILLVNNNKDLNRYIDLESTKTVDFGNSDLPSNIFDKPDDDSDFYEISPIELSQICKQKSKVLKSATAKNLNSQTENIVSILNQINQIRFDLETYMKGHDLNEKESVYGVYEYLERVVQLFDNYEKAHNRLAGDIKDSYRKTTDKMYLGFFEIHSAVKSVLHSMRAENDANIKNQNLKIESALSSYRNTITSYKGKAHSKNYDYTTRVITEKTEKVITLVKEYENPGSIPIQHELYGKHYYYHNQLLIHYFNWSGPGFVRDMNALLTELKVPFILFDEEPLIFKVIYPVKVLEAKALEEKPVVIDRSTPPIENKLQFSEKKEVETKDKATKKVIETTDKSIVLEIYDDNIIDRDSVSVTFNGKLLLENYTLTGIPEKFVVELEEGKENKLVVEAKNLGLIAPNTFIVTYRSVGKRKKVKIESELLTNEVLTLLLEP